MRNYFKSLAITFLSIGLLTACDKSDETSNPTVSFNFNTVNTASSVPAARTASANTLAFTSGTITLSRIEFEADLANGDSIEARLDQTVVIDFATGETNPSLPNLVFPVGNFVESSVELELLDENNIPSVILEGTFVDGQGQSHPVRFEFNSGETFEVEKEGVYAFEAGKSIVAEVTFDPSVWFMGVSGEMLEAATKNGQGVIVISETSNPEIFDIAADGLDLATEIEITF